MKRAASGCCIPASDFSITLLQIVDCNNLDKNAIFKKQVDYIMKFKQVFKIGVTEM